MKSSVDASPPPFVQGRSQREDGLAFEVGEEDAVFLAGQLANDGEKVTLKLTARYADRVQPNEAAPGSMDPLNWLLRHERLCSRVSQPRPAAAARPSD